MTQSGEITQLTLHLGYHAAKAHFLDGCQLETEEGISI